MEYEKNFIMNIASGFMGTFVLSAACEIRVFDALAEGSMTLEELAEKTGTESGQLVRLLRPLVVYKLISRDSRGVYSLEKAGRMLIRADRNSMWGYVMFCGQEAAKVWSRLGQALLEKRSLREYFDEADMFEKQGEDRERFTIFDGMMKNVSAGIDLSGFFSGFGDRNMPYRIVDIGGGTGTIMAKFLNYYRESSGIILDLPQAKDEAEQNMEAAGLSGRCVFRPGNFFEDIGITGDMVILSRVLHDWSDEHAVNILQNTAECLSEDGKLLVIENIMTETADRNALETYMNDIQMWGFCGSRERTKEEFTELFAHAGLELQEVRQTAEKSSVCVMVACRNNTEEGEI